MRLRKIRTKELRGAVRMEAVWDPDARSKANNQEITLPLVPVQPTNAPQPWKQWENKTAPSNKLLHALPFTAMLLINSLSLLVRI